MGKKRSLKGCRCVDRREGQTHNHKRKKKKKKEESQKDRRLHRSFFFLPSQAILPGTWNREGRDRPLVLLVPRMVGAKNSSPPMMVVLTRPMCTYMVAGINPSILQVLQSRWKLDIYIGPEARGLLTCTLDYHDLRGLESRSIALSYTICRPKVSKHIHTLPLKSSTSISLQNHSPVLLSQHGYLVLPSSLLLRLPTQ